MSICGNKSDFAFTCRCCGSKATIVDWSDEETYCDGCALESASQTTDKLPENHICTFCHVGPNFGPSKTCQDQSCELYDECNHKDCTFGEFPDKNDSGCPIDQNPTPKGERACVSFHPYDAPPRTTG